MALRIKTKEFACNPSERDRVSNWLISDQSDLDIVNVSLQYLGKEEPTGYFRSEKEIWVLVISYRDEDS